MLLEKACEELCSYCDLDVENLCIEIYFSTGLKNLQRGKMAYSLVHLGTCSGVSFN